MEDRHVTLSELTTGVWYSAVFDGHGGAKTAEFAQNNLHNIIRESQFYKKDEFGNNVANENFSLGKYIKKYGMMLMNLVEKVITFNYK